MQNNNYSNNNENQNVPDFNNAPNYNNNPNYNNIPNYDNGYQYNPNMMYQPPRRKAPKILSAILVGLLLLSGGFVAGSTYQKTKTAVSPKINVGSKNPGNTNGNLPADWNKLNVVKDKIYKFYNGEIDENKLLEGAVKGMVNSLGDPYSVFYNAKEYKDTKDQGNGKFVGIGVQVQGKDGYIVVVSLIDGGPAKEAGILPGDKIIKVEDKQYSDKQLEEAIKVIKGEAGKPVKITVSRADKTLDFNIVRREIKQNSVSSEMLNDSMGYIKVTQFNRGTADEFNAAMLDLKVKGMKGLVMDLRGNPGGYLDESIKLASNFIKKGDLVVYEMDKYGHKTEQKSVDGSSVGLPLVVLVDQGSASASEVVSGALKDYNAATFVGSKTFGKGIVQSVMDLANGEGLKLTIAAYYSPKGTNIHKIGITPDIVVEIPEDILAKPYDRKADPQFKKAIETLQEKMK